MQLEALEGLSRPKVPPAEEMKNFNGKFAGFRCTGRAEWGQFAAAGPHGLSGESEMPNADDDAPRDIYSMSLEEAMHEAALEQNKTATPLYRATRLSEEAWALIEQNVAETRTLTERKMKTTKMMKVNHRRKVTMLMKLMNSKGRGKLLLRRSRRSLTEH